MYASHTSQMTNDIKSLSYMGVTQGWERVAWRRSESVLRDAGVGACCVTSQTTAVKETKRSLAAGTTLILLH